MSFVKSLLFGSEGSYNILGIPVTFQEKSKIDYCPYINETDLISRLGALYSKCVKYSIYRFISQNPSHKFCHEMGHVLAYKMLGWDSIEATIWLNGGTSRARLMGTSKRWENTAICLAGPMSNMAYASAKLVAAIAFKRYISLPAAVSLGIGSGIAIAQEIIYATVSGLTKDQGDFGQIAQEGRVPLAVASIALVSEIALGVFAAVMLA